MISVRIKELRNKLHMTQVDFGRLLGTSRDVISNFEHNRSVPKDAFLDLICRLFGVRSEWIFNGDGEMFEDGDRATSKEVEEATRIYMSLEPRLRRYALQQIKGLLELQEGEWQ